jgi:hypothetical protein
LVFQLFQLLLFESLFQLLVFQLFPRSLSFPQLRLLPLSFAMAGAANATNSNAILAAARTNLMRLMMLPPCLILLAKSSSVLGGAQNPLELDLKKARRERTEASIGIRQQYLVLRTPGGLLITRILHPIFRSY